LRRILVLFLCAAGLGALNFVAGCGGGGSNTNNKVASVSITPTILSLTKGQTQQVTVSTLNADGKAVTPQNTVTFTLTPPSTPQSPAILASISNSGLICAGTWDSTTNPVVCQTIADNPATPSVEEGVGTMALTATADGITSAPITLYVHEPVTGISANLVSTSTAPGPGGCLSQGTEALFTASVAGPGGVDITPSVGPINFVSTAPTVAAIDTTVTPAPPPTEQYFKANVPGKALIYASVSGTNGVATPLYTCSPASIALTPASGISLAAKATQVLTSAVIDVNGVTLTNIPLNWSVANALVATVTSGVPSGTTTSPGVTYGTITGGSSPGTTYISASCAPPSCNVNLEKPMYSNRVPVTVTGTATTPAIYVASSATPTSGVTNLIPINFSSNTTGTAIPFATGQVPNSMTFGQSSSLLWIGTNTGLVNLDPSVSTPVFGTTYASVKGKILAMAPNGGSLVVSDTTAGLVHLVTISSKTDTILNIPGATAASYLPDGSGLYIAAGDKLFAYMPAFSSAPRQINLAAGATASDVSVLANGQLWFVAENSQFDVRATCDRATYDTHAASPLNLFSLPDGSQMIATDTANVWGIGVTWTPPQNVVCVPSLTALTDNWASQANPGGAFNARQIIVTPDSKHVYITNDTNSLIAYDPATGTVSNINIGAATFTGASTMDSSKVYVGAADGKVHVITTSSNTDATQIAISGLCTGTCLPDLVAVQPK
jgi:hypothetical protein